MTATALDPAARLKGVTLRRGHSLALDALDVELPAACMVGLIGPDGVGKSSLLALVAGAHAVQHGEVQTLGADMGSRRGREQVRSRIAYMPQGLGRNLYPTLSIEENLQFFGRLFGHDAAERRRRIDQLTRATGLDPFLGRPADKLSGGMKQKLGLCCALIHDPDLLILDEPTTGVDPLSRSQFWSLIADLRRQRPTMSVIVATAYMEEAERFDWLVAMDQGRVLACGTPSQLRERTAAPDLDAAFIALLPPARRAAHRAIVLHPLQPDGLEEPAIDAVGLTRRFGDFLAVDHADFRIRRGEIFGFIGSNGCGKSTTMKMLTGLLAPSEGEVRLFGRTVDSRDVASRRRVGYMSQSFSLYGELTVRQNLALHARLFAWPEPQVDERVHEMSRRFGLEEDLDRLPESLPLGVRQRLSLAVAMVHAPELLILDEPTSGVDPIARDSIWQLMIDLARRDRVTIFISTHFMSEAERCDRVALMHAGRVLVTEAPARIVADRGVATLEEAFIGWLVDAAASAGPAPAPTPVMLATETEPVREKSRRSRRSWFSGRRALSYAIRETLELMRDPVRATLALVGTAILMFIIGYGINLDVENLAFAVLDFDQTSASSGYALNLSGSRYFVEHAPLHDHEELDRRMRSGELALAIEIPPGFGRQLGRGAPATVGAWIDGSMPSRAETIRGYVQAMHAGWLAEQARKGSASVPAAGGVMEIRFRYNPDVRSLPAMVPAVIPMLLMMVPAMLAALSVVREKELGSIINLYVTPVSRIEFILGKQLPYVVLALLNFALLTGLAVTVFRVPLKGDLASLTLAAFVYVIGTTGLGLLASSFTRTQIAAIFITMIGTLVPCIQFSGMLNPVASLEGVGAFIGAIYPAGHFLTISRGVFSKGLDLHSLWPAFWPLLAAVPIIDGLAIAALRKQEH